MSRSAALIAVVLLLSAPVVAETLEVGTPVVMRAAAVSETRNGFVGSTATITITSAANGSGHVFLDTFPLTQVDMQGSARLAARVAAQLTGKDLHAHDFFFVVRSSAEQIGGPSAGATMSVGAIASLNGWKVREDVLMTGTINADATVGPVGGIAEKAAAAANVGVTRFLFPAGEEIVPLGDALINLTEYCSSQLRIECIPVGDIVDAVGLMTDHVFQRPAVREDVTGDEFLKLLGPLSRELVDEAQRIHTEARTALNALPEGAAKTTLTERLAAAGVLVARTANETANGTYYTAASTSFQSSIESRYVREASEYLASTDRAFAHVESLQEARAIVRDATRTVGAARVEDTNSFEAVGAAQVRLMDAESRIAQADALAAQPRNSEDLFLALHHAAYAAERARTATWWLKLADGFPAGQPIDADGLVELARDTITTSTEEVAYSEAVFQGAGGVAGRSADLLDDARTLLTQARAGMERKFYAAAMLNALDASVRASVALEIASFGGTVPDARLKIVTDNAARAIQGARARGVESLLAQSAYEFGLSRDDTADKLAFLGLARVSGNLAGLPGMFGKSIALDSRFQTDLPPLRVAITYVAAAFAVGLALGAGAGLAAMMPSTKRGSPPQEPAPPDAQSGGPDPHGPDVSFRS